MHTIVFPKAYIEELTTLEVALEVYQKENFFAHKKKLLGHEFNRKVQQHIWEHYHYLLYRAASKTLNEQDLDILKQYCQKEGHVEILADQNRLFFPTQLTRDNQGGIADVTFNYVDNEVTKRWFIHIGKIWQGEERINICSSPKCENLFIGRKDQQYCSVRCRKYTWDKKYRGKKKSP
jgi:hypothetical protein